MAQYFREFRDLNSDLENFSIIVGVATFCVHMCIARMIVGVHIIMTEISCNGSMAGRGRAIDHSCM